MVIPDFPNARTFGDRLILLMRRDNYTNKALGDKIGVSGQSVGKWKTNGNIEFEKLTALADVFKVNWIWLRYGEEALHAVCEKRAQDMLAEERRKWIEELKYKEAWNRLALKAANIGTWDAYPETDCLNWSPTTFEIFGVDPKTFTGKKSFFDERVYPPDLEKLQQDYIVGLNSPDGKYRCDHRIVLPDNSLRWVRERGQVFKDEDGKPSRVLGVVYDITEAVEHRLQSQLLDALFSGCDEKAIVIIRDNTWNITNVTLGACNLLGYERHEVIGLNALDFAPEMSNQDFYEISAEGARREEGIAIDISAKAKDGSLMMVKAHVGHIYIDGDGLNVVHLSAM